MRRNVFAILLFAVLLVLAPLQARAACTGGVGGEVVYNKDHHVLQYCDGTDWIAMGTAGSGGSTGPTGCPAIGDTCSDGSYYIGQVGGNDIYAADAATETITSWNNGNIAGITQTNLLSTTDGSGNTTGLTEHPGGGACQDGDIW